MCMDLRGFSQKLKLEVKNVYFQSLTLEDLDLGGLDLSFTNCELLFK